MAWQNEYLEIVCNGSLRLLWLFRAFLPVFASVQSTHFWLLDGLFWFFSIGRLISPDKTAQSSLLEVLMINTFQSYSGHDEIVNSMKMQI